MALHYSVPKGILPNVLPVVTHYLTCTGSIQNPGKPRNFSSAVFTRCMTDSATLFLMGMSFLFFNHNSLAEECSERLKGTQGHQDLATYRQKGKVQMPR